MEIKNCICGARIASSCTFTRAVHYFTPSKRQCLGEKFLSTENETPLAFISESQCGGQKLDHIWDFTRFFNTALAVFSAALVLTSTWLPSLQHLCVPVIFTQVVSDQDNRSTKMLQDRNLSRERVLMSAYGMGEGKFSLIPCN